MTITYFPFDAGAGANVVEADWGSFAKNFNPTGVLWGQLNELLVFADSSGMQVKVQSGRCWIEGFWMESDAEETLAIAAADPTDGRIDRIVARVDWSANTMALVVLTGTPDPSPVAPSITKGTTTYEIALAQVLVDAGVGTIAAAKVTDERGYSLGASQPIIQLYAPAASTQTLTTGVWADLVVTNVWDKGGSLGYDLANNYINFRGNALNPLLTEIVWHVEFPINSVGDRLLRLQNWNGAWGNTFELDIKRGTANNKMILNGVFHWFADDSQWTRIKLQVKQDSGGNLDVNLPYWSIKMVQTPILDAG